MNYKSGDNQILQANPPVVPAGVILVRSLTTSAWFESLAGVFGVGCSKSVWSLLPQGIDRERNCATVSVNNLDYAIQKTMDARIKSGFRNPKR